LNGKQAKSLVLNLYPPSTFHSEGYGRLQTPLACEGSIRVLRSVFDESAVAAAGSESRGDELFEQHYFNGRVSSSLNEQLPFANDNCETIRSRDGSSVAREEKLTASISVSQPCIPLRDFHGVFSDDTVLCSYSLMASNGDVLSDIGNEISAQIALPNSDPPVHLQLTRERHVLEDDRMAVYVNRKMAKINRIENAVS
uniref:ZP domain-containing protein n=1 Tax=Gongylonema pulchrum TaxID=637853 RepID=A0A183EBV0_9BILA